MYLCILKWIYFLCFTLTLKQNCEIIWSHPQKKGEIQNRINSSDTYMQININTLIHFGTRMRLDCQSVLAPASCCIFYHYGDTTEESSFQSVSKLTHITVIVTWRKSTKTLYPSYSWINIDYWLLLFLVELLRQSFTYCFAFNCHPTSQPPWSSCWTNNYHRAAVREGSKTCSEFSSVVLKMCTVYHTCQD